MMAGSLTCTQLVSAYVQVNTLYTLLFEHVYEALGSALELPDLAVWWLQRIYQFDSPGPNAYRALSPTLVQDAAAKDAELLAVCVRHPGNSLASAGGVSRAESF